MPVLCCALCLSACQLRVDLALLATPNGHVDVIVAVQADPPVRSALDRAGVAPWSSAGLAERADGWEATDTAPLGLPGDALGVRATDVPVDQVADRVAALVAGIGLGDDLLQVAATAPDGDAAAGLDTTVQLRPPSPEGLRAAGLDIDEERWAAALARADEVVTAGVHLATSSGAPVEPVTGDGAPGAVPSAGGWRWPVELGEPRVAAVRPTPSPSRRLLPWALGGLAAGIVAALAWHRRRER